MKRRTEYRILIGVAFFIIGLGIIKNQPQWVDQYYAEIFYPIISNLNQWLWSRFPFSVGDLGYCIALIFCLWSLTRFSFNRHVLKAITILGLVVVLFYSSWGVHYFKTPIREQRQLNANLSLEQLQLTATYYAKRLTKLHNELSAEPNKKVVIDASAKELLRLATATMKTAALRPPNINGKAKATLFPSLLSYMGFGGYANPFTHEAQVNTRQPKLKIITTACHEIAHQWGYAAEDEANYISIKACIASENKLIDYAGNMLAFQYLTNALYRYDSKLAQEQYTSVPEGVLVHFKEVQMFWQKYQNPFEAVFEKSYDQYLRANHQQAGIKSYSLVVDLLVDDMVKTQ